jgi:F420H(2)-dependent quinone reductase
MPLEGDYLPCRYQEVADQVALYEATAGQQGSEFAGGPCVILTTIGAHSGKLRKVALMRVEQDGAYVLVGSMGGQPQNPDWVHNVRAHPRVTVQDGPTVHDLAVREVANGERARCWSLALEVFARYDEYQERTEREIPVFVAQPESNTPDAYP